MRNAPASRIYPLQNAVARSSSNTTFARFVSSSPAGLQMDLSASPKSRWMRPGLTVSRSIIAVPLPVTSSIMMLLTFGSPWNMRFLSSPFFCAISRQSARSRRSSMNFARRFASIEDFRSSFASFDLSVWSYFLR